MDNLQMIPLTLCLMKSALAAGTTTTYTTTGVTHYLIKGKAYSVAAATNAATPTTDVVDGLAFATVSANQGSVYIFGYNATGAIKVAQGAVEALDASGAFILAPQLPVLPDDFCPIGYLVVQAGSTAVGTWTFGTNNNSGVTGLTYTFGSLGTLPDRPFIS